MADIIFYWDQISDATITASYGDITNLKDRNPNHKWTSTSLTNQQSVTIDFGSEKSCDSVLLDGINFGDTYDDGPQTQTVLIESSSNGSDWDSRGTLSNVSTKQALSFSSVSERYWRIYIAVNTGSFLTYPTIGNIFLGTKITMTNIPYNASHEYGKQYLTTKSRSLNGTWYSSQMFAGAAKWFIKFANFSDAIRTNLLTLFSGVRGNFYPFYFSDSDSTLNLVILNSDLNTIETKAYGVHDSVDLELEEYTVS